MPCVHAWVAHFEEPATSTIVCAARAQLTHQELTRADAARKSVDRDHRILGRALARYALSQCAAVAPRDWRFALGPCGRPEIAWPLVVPRLHFNVAHASGIAACAVADDLPVGVDVEAMDRVSLIDEIEVDVLGAHERAALAGQPAAVRSRGLYVRWTLKEAYAKARGIGIGVPLRAIEFDIRSCERPQVRFGAGIADDESAWTFECIEPTDRHVASVALRAGTRNGHVEWHVSELSDSLLATDVAG